MNQRHTTGVEDYNSDYLECRENHNWRWVNDWKIVKGVKGNILQFTRLKRCEQCKTLCHRTYDGRTGKVVRTHYDYPNGYLASSNNPIDAGMARLEMLRRAEYV